MKGWFNFYSPETLYFYVRITRYFGVATNAVHIPYDQVTDAEAIGKYSETVERYEIVERHSHLSRSHSVDLWRKLIERDAIFEFRGNIQVLTCLSDQSGYADYCEKSIEFESMMETRLK